MYRRTLFALCLFLWAGISVSAQAQEKKDNHFEVSKNLEIFNSLVKEVEMLCRLDRRGQNSASWY